MATAFDIISGPDAEAIARADYHRDMLAREARYVVYAPEASYLEFRQFLVEFVFEIGKYCKLSPFTVPTAIQYVDRILAVLNVDKHSLYLVTACCSLIAAKFMDTEDKVPSINELHDWCLTSYSRDEIRRNEVVMAEQLDWRFQSVTPMHFVQFYLTFSDVSEDKLVNDENNPANGNFIQSSQDDSAHFTPIKKKSSKGTRFWADFFMAEYINDYSFQKYRPSIVAAATLAASRRVLGVAPLWPQRLITLTTHSASDIRECEAQLYCMYEKKYPTGTKTSPTSVMDL